MKYFEEMKYFEVIFGDNYTSLCGKGLRVPTVKEAQEFYRHDVNDYANGHPVTAVVAISFEEAASAFDLENEKDWPIFR